MPTNVKVKDLKINTLTEAQYDTAVQSGVIGENEISILTDVDTSIQVSTMPAASSANEDKIYQYIGTTDANYTNGYFYKCSGSAEKSATASQTSGSGLTNINVDIDTFETQINVSGSYDFMYDDWEGTWTFHSEPADLTDYGITYTGTPNDFDTITVIYSTGGGFVWNRIDVQPAPVIPDPLPSQTGNAGKFLTTDGTDASWSDKPLENNDEGYNSLGILDTDGGGNCNVVIGKNSTASGYGSFNTVVGENASSSVNSGTVIGRNAKVTGHNAIQLGTGSNGTAVTNADADTFKVANKNGNFEIMSSDGSIPSDRLKNAVRNYSSLPTASVSYENVIVEYTGTTDSNYTNGYFYKCSPDYSSASVTFTPQTGTTSTISIAPADFAKFVNQILANMGQSSRVITHGFVARNWGEKYEVMLDTDTGWGTGQSKTQAELEAAGFTFSAPLELGEGFDYVCSNLTPTYAWTQTNVQPASSGLPDQTGQSGKFLTTDGTDASWADILIHEYSNSGITIGSGTWNAANSVAIGKNAHGASSSVIIGAGGTQGYTNNVVIGYGAQGTNDKAIAIGHSAIANAVGSIQINTSGSNKINNDANTVKIANANGNFEIMSADGTIPTDRFTTTPVADGTYVPTLTISSGVATRSWGAGGGGGSVPTLTWYSVQTAGNTLTIADTSSAQLVKIYKNGLLLQPTDDYTISGTTLTTVGALVVGDKITTEVF